MGLMQTAALCTGGICGFLCYLVEGLRVEGLGRGGSDTSQRTKGNLVSIGTAVM